MLTGQATTLSTSYNINPVNFIPTFCTFPVTNPPRPRAILGVHFFLFPTLSRGSPLLIPCHLSAPQKTLNSAIQNRQQYLPAVYTKGPTSYKTIFLSPSKINTIVPSTAKNIKFTNGVNIKSISPTHLIKNVAGIKTNRLNT